MSLYQKYRPKTFADVVGQEHVVTTLEQAHKQDKLSHAYLFSGTRGTGKTSIARILAKILLIRGIEDEKMQMQIIEAVEDGNIVDVIEIDAASNRRIDDVRSLLEAIQFAPVAGKAKVYIIDEAHMLTKEAFNALLKTLEEPPPYAYFVLATTELHKIPATIQSRCQRFAFRTITEEDIVRRLQYIADQERITVERPALRAIAHHVQGSLRDAVSLLDQLQALGTVTLKDVRERVGESGQEYAETLRTALAEGDTRAILATIETMEEMAVPLDGVLRILLARTREDMRSAIAAGQATEPFIAMLDILLEAVRDARAAPVPGLILESAMLRLLKIRHGEAPAEKIVAETPAPTRVRPAPSAAPKPAKPPTEKIETPPPAQAATEAPSLSLEEIRKAWPDILHSMQPPSVKMSLKNGRLQAVTDGNLTLSFASAFHRDKVAATEASRALEQAIEAVFRRAVRVHCVLEEERSSGGAQAEEVVNLAEAAAEVF
jgi:DNA polymerase-3 subunit gamma/tau